MFKKISGRFSYGKARRIIAYPAPGSQNLKYFYPAAGVLSGVKFCKGNSQLTVKIDRKNRRFFYFIKEKMYKRKGILYSLMRYVNI